MALDQFRESPFGKPEVSFELDLGFVIRSGPLYRSGSIYRYEL